jgi:hypothetical protein
MPLIWDFEKRIWGSLPSGDPSTLVRHAPCSAGEGASAAFTVGQGSRARGFAGHGLGASNPCPPVAGGVEGPRSSPLPGGLGPVALLWARQRTRMPRRRPTSCSWLNGSRLPRSQDRRRDGKGNPYSYAYMIKSVRNSRGRRRLRQKQACPASGLVPAAVRRRGGPAGRILIRRDVLDGIE